jgi:high affinity Mn2+ porin
MDRTRAKGLASALSSPVFWLGGAAALLTAGCATLDGPSGPSSGGSKPACACESPADPSRKPANGGSSQPANGDSSKPANGGSSQPANGRSSKPAARGPRTVRQAIRAYLNCLHKPLSQRGPAMSGGGVEDTGVSRYPPAEGERNSERGAATIDAGGPGDTGVSRYPPAEGERTPSRGQPQPPAGEQPNQNEVPAIPPLPEIPNSAEPELQAPAARNTSASESAPASAAVVSMADDAFPSPSIDDEIARAAIASAAPGAVPLDRQTIGPDGERGDDGQESSNRDVPASPPADAARNARRAGPMTIAYRQGNTGVSRYPPAEGERNDSSAGLQPTAVDTWYSVHEQATVVSMVHNVFPSPYIGKNSLLPNEPAANTMTGTVFFAARLCESERNDTQLIFNPEAAGGAGFSKTTGIAGFPNGEATRVGVENPTPYIARLYLRQTFGFGGEREDAPDGVNQVAGQRDVRRLAVIFGKMAAPDIVDDNRYSHDPRTQFLNWALVYNGAWDYPANVRGYTYGLAFDYNHSKNVSFAYAVLMEPASANGGPLDWHLLKAQGQVAEIEDRYELFGRPGAIRPLAYLNHAHMGDYNEALQLMPVDPNIIKTRSYRYKYGFGLNIDQELTDDIGFFSRLGWNDGHTETWAFTEIDRTASAGLVMGGRLWCRPYDRVGLAGILNGLSGPHREYLAAGGLGFIIGDGKLNYGPEEIVEMYYSIQIRPGLVVTFDFQEVGNPAYNRDRGPVSIFGLRVHWDR